MCIRNDDIRLPMRLDLLLLLWLLLLDCRLFHFAQSTVSNRIDSSLHFTFRVGFFFIYYTQQYRLHYFIVGFFFCFVYECVHVLLRLIPLSLGTVCWMHAYWKGKAKCRRIFSLFFFLVLLLFLLSHSSTQINMYKMWIELMVMLPPSSHKVLSSCDAKRTMPIK